MTASWCEEDVVRRAGVLFVERVDCGLCVGACKSLLLLHSIHRVSVPLEVARRKYAC